MSDLTESTSEQFFDEIYRESEDPWSFSNSAYETGRYQAILKALQRDRFWRAFEPGCSIGVLTEQLAARCDEVEAIDISATAVARARQRCAGLPNVRIQQGALPEAIPGGMFDLVVFSEIGYYFSVPRLRAIVKQLVDQLATGGVLLGVHWLGVSSDHVLSGDEVNDTIQAAEGISLSYSKREVGYRLDRWVRL